MLRMEFRVPENENVKAFLRTRGTKVRASVLREITSISVDLQTKVKQEKLRGGNPLHSRTGNLSRAVSRRVDNFNGQAFQAVVGVAPNAPYGKIHEFGGTIHVPEVKGKLMVFTANGKKVFTRSHKAFDVLMPERSFLRSSLAESKVKFQERLRDAVYRGLKA
jgi:phage gpG-like protein